MAEKHYKGRVAAPGLALGPLFHLPDLAVAADRPAGTPEAEMARLTAAIAAAREQLALLLAEGEEMAAEILGFQLEMLADPALVETAAALVAEGAPAVRAWQEGLAPQVEVFAGDDDPYFRARAADLVDLRDRVMAALAGGGPAMAPPAGAIVTARDLTPSRFLGLDWAALGGAALGAGSAASHVAMLARARGIPLVTGLGPIEPVAATAVLDARDGFLVVGPKPATERRYRGRLAVDREEARAAAKVVAEPARTASGRPISVMVNVDDPDAVPDDLLRAGDGVGLLRTEFLFIGRAERPDEETQYRAYARLLQRLGGRPLILRTLDIGGDKPLPDLDIPAETNPFLGLRGLRLCLDRPELFRPQVRAALRAAADGPLSIMLPMVSRAAEVLEARSFIEAEARALDLAVPPVGIMVETPAAALALDTMPVDFASIGSNDLTQYVMAASRDAGGRVAELIDPLDPAVLRLIRMVVEMAAARGLPLSLCGDMASDRAGIEALVAIGIERVSVAPAALGRVKLWIAGCASRAHGLP
jgi:phosphotransferase system enzyme I (PtsI)